jgi:ABC-type polar amino acid transport system ATPase subunit
MIETHEMAFARDFADRVMFMVQGELFEDQGARDFFRAPRNEPAKLFVARHE